MPASPSAAPADLLSDTQIDQLLARAESKLRDRNHKATQALQHRTTHISTHKPSPSQPHLPAPYVQTTEHISNADPHRLLSEQDRRLGSHGVRRVEDPLAVKRRKHENKKATAGSQWYNLPATNLTPALKRDLDLLRMRSILDPKRFYKKDASSTAVPQFSQTGTLVEGPTEFYSARLTRAERKTGLMEEVVEGERDSGYFGKRYKEVQERKRSGKKGYYRDLMRRRYGRGRERGRR